MKAKLLSIKGKEMSEIVLPTQFTENYRPIIIMRAFNVNLSQTYQHQGVEPSAGLTKCTDLSKRRRKYRGVYGAGRSRTPKKVISRRGARFNYVADKAPNARKGRTAHPPKVEKIFEEKINRKEKLLAIRSAISATINKDLVVGRGHKIGNITLPLIIEGAEKINKTKDAKSMLELLGLKSDLERSSIKLIRSGKGKMRGRKYKKRKGPLVVVSEYGPLSKAAMSLPGVDIIAVKDLNVTLLAPGGKAGRLTVWTKNAVNIMNEKNLFMGEMK